MNKSKFEQSLGVTICVVLGALVLLTPFYGFTPVIIGLGALVTGVVCAHHVLKFKERRWNN